MIKQDSLWVVKPGQIIFDERAVSYDLLIQGLYTGCT